MNQYYHPFKSLRITNLHPQPEQGKSLIIRYDSKANQKQVVCSNTRTEQIDRETNKLFPFCSVSSLSKRIREQQKDK